MLAEKRDEDSGFTAGGKNGLPLSHEVWFAIDHHWNHIVALRTHQYELNSRFDNRPAFTRLAILSELHLWN
jgi:hypothetical protein